MGVLFKNADITIYNHYFDGDVDKYQRTVIKGINWQSKRKATSSRYTRSINGLASDDSVLIFIDNLPNFKKPKEFLRLSDKTGYFTLAPGDKVVKGELDYEISATNSVKKLEQQYDDVLTILGCSYLSGHMEVEGK